MGKVIYNGLWGLAACAFVGITTEYEITSWQWWVLVLALSVMTSPYVTDARK